MVNCGKGSHYPAGLNNGTGKSCGTLMTNRGEVLHGSTALGEDPPVMLRLHPVSENLHRSWHCGAGNPCSRLTSQRFRTWRRPRSCDRLMPLIDIYRPVQVVNLFQARFVLFLNLEVERIWMDMVCFVFAWPELYVVALNGQKKICFVGRPSFSGLVPDLDVIEAYCWLLKINNQPSF